MKKINLSEEQLKTISYSDAAYLILSENGKKMKIQDLFKEVIKTMNLDENVFENHLADFFGLLSTDKRFVMIEKGYWDLKINHKSKVVIEDEDEDIIEEEIIEETEEDGSIDDEKINYDDEIMDDDEDDDDLKDLVVMDDGEESEIVE